MPNVTIVNDTQVPLHIALRHISPIHFVNNVPPGGQAVFKHVGRVWFTIEARIARSAGERKSSQDDQAPHEHDLKKKHHDDDDSYRARLRRAKENNEYTILQSVAAPVAVSVAALSLGAGAIYLGAVASAAGGVSAAVSSTVSSVSASAASQAPTVQRFYKYAMKGYQVAQIGSVVGIGGKALSDSTKQEKAEPAASTTTTTTTTKEHVNTVKEALGYLITNSAVKSHGWYMKKDRTFRIRGGPKAAELENWVIIETDTLTPFEIVSDDPNEKPDPEAEKEAMEHEKAEAAAV
jgi:methylmalonyl-CoA mutase cobalamin-binding subunit